jgi:hypothetical protein
MFLPWYEPTTVARVGRGLESASYDLSAFGAFSWIEAAVLVVAVAVLVLCFTRGEQRSYHLPGGDGVIVAGGGIWVALLIFIRFLDKPDVRATAVGITWGIFIALMFGLLLAYAGLRIRHAHQPEPDAMDEAMATGRAPRERAPRARPRVPTPSDSSADDTRMMLPDEEPTRPATRRDLPEKTGTPPTTPDPAPTPTPSAPRSPDSGEQLRFDD